MTQPKIIWIDNNLTFKDAYSFKDKTIFITTNEIYDYLINNNKLGDIIFVKQTKKTYKLFGRIISFGKNRKIVTNKIDPDLQNHTKQWFINKWLEQSS